jgi:hypothetical protein
MDKHTVVELKAMAKTRGLKGYSKLTKPNLLKLLFSKPKLQFPNNFDFIPFIKPSGWKFSGETQAYLNTIFNRLSTHLLNDVNFLEKLGYLGEEAADRARRSEHTKYVLIPELSLEQNNIILYIALELFDLAQYAPQPLTPSKIRNIIENDYELSAAFKN